MLQEPKLHYMMPNTLEEVQFLSKIEKQGEKDKKNRRMFYKKRASF